MKETRDLRLLLGNILEAIQNIEEFTSGLTEGEFYQEKMALHAVIKNLGDIGEACRKLPIEFKEINNSIPWINIITMRHRLSHEYFNTSETLVYKTITIHMLKLKSQILAIIATL